MVLTEADGSPPQIPLKLGNAYQQASLCQPAMRTILLLLLLLTPSCTLCKPVVCAFTTPIHFIGATDGDILSSCPSEDAGYAILAALSVASGIGIVGGLITGFISDINVMTGAVEPRDSMRHLIDPFETNAKTEIE